MSNHIQGSFPNAEFSNASPFFNSGRAPQSSCLSRLSPEAIENLFHFCGPIQTSQRNASYIESNRITRNYQATTGVKRTKQAHCFYE